MKTNKLDVPPWWSDTENSVWPKKQPDRMTYKWVHVFDSDIGPWCSYVLVHSETVAASSLTTKDLSKFYYRRSVNELVLGRTQAFLKICEKVELILKKC